VRATGRLADHLGEVGARERRHVQDGRRDRHRELGRLGGHPVPHVGAGGHHDAQRGGSGAARGERLQERPALGLARHRDQLLGLVDHHEDLGVGGGLPVLAQLADVLSHPAGGLQELEAPIGIQIGVVELGRVGQGERHLGQGHVGRGPGVGDHPVRRDPQGGHQPGADQGRLAAAGGPEHRDDRALVAPAGRVDELTQLVDLAVPAEEDGGVRLVERAQTGERRPGRVPARLLVEAEGHQRRAQPVEVDVLGGDLHALQVRGQRVRWSAVDEEGEDRLAQPAGQRQLGVAPLALDRLGGRDEDDGVAAVEVGEELVAPGLAGDEAPGRVEVEEHRGVAQLGQAVLHLGRQRVVDRAVRHEDLRHPSPPSLAAG
jgi:hypothetical protein